MKSIIFLFVLTLSLLTLAQDITKQGCTRRDYEFNGKYIHKDDNGDDSVDSLDNSHRSESSGTTIRRKGRKEKGSIKYVKNYFIDPHLDFD